jgi:hypothetical protein
MNKQIDSARLKYAVIEALWTEGRRECIVIAYADEHSLCDLIAARSIVALGFASREKAAASIENCSPLSPASKQMARTVMVKGIKKYQQVVYSAKRRLADGFSRSRSRQVPTVDVHRIPAPMCSVQFASPRITPPVEMRRSVYGRTIFGFSQGFFATAAIGRGDGNPLLSCAEHLNRVTFTRCQPTKKEERSRSHREGAILKVTRCDDSGDSLPSMPNGSWRICFLCKNRSLFCVSKCLS